MKKKATPHPRDLKRESKKVAQLVESRGLVSALNNTKWRELCGEMRAFASFTPRFQILDILGEYPAPWDSEWYYHPYPYFSIEWLDIDPVGHEPEVIEALQRCGAPYSREGAFLRVWGYFNPGSPPAFVL